MDKVIYIDSEGFLQPLDLLVVSDSEFDAFPEVEMLTAEVSGKDGSYVFGSRYKDRVFDLHLVSRKNYDCDSLKSGWREASKFFDAKNGWLDFIRADSPNMIAKVRVIKSYRHNISINYLNFEVSLLVQDGVFKSVNESSITGNTGFYNDSDTITPIKLVCLKNGSGKAKITVNGKSMLAPNEKGVVIDSEKYTATKNGLNCLNDVEGDFLFLEQGKNEVVIPDGWELRYREWRWF